MQAEQQKRFNCLVDQALQQSFKGWDFRYLVKRMTEETLPWSYPDLARQKVKRVRAFLDMGTGGGEMLAILAPFPSLAVATEAYLPNIPVAAETLRPLGVPVVGVGSEERDLPFRSDLFDLALNRHESYWPQELFRILAPGGIFLTQQVGGKDNRLLNEALQEEVFYEFEDWLCERAVSDLQNAGFEIVKKEEAFPEVLFHDIGAVIFYLKVISWQIPDFSVEKYRERLFELHLQIERAGVFRSHSHRFLIEARKPF